ncbi:Crp/Fnr family transcriptional regulator [Spirosoma montaniterrae]|uniref:Cyclic nucleotide-binding domain-containing protein n=1 Tax=Spirosoma montaniterrae TaxID=1178516 RepID=A0A1P9WV82_9BACT|nr:Crp/Fnr family transcriptional regulator [Spirosoma montaniterrae]AQG79269.1 hypothetical protein AWR27_07980 [Spirosoma montaniterrae]
MTHPLLAYFAQFIPLSPVIEDAVAASFMHQSLKRGDYLLEAGQTASYAHFVVSGALRVFTHTERADITIWLGLAGSMVVSLPSFIERKPSPEWIQAIDDTRVYSVHYNALQQLYDAHPELDRLGRLLIERYAIQLREHGFSLRCHTTTERYENLLRQRPELFEQVPLTHIASFLGMTPQAMSLARAKR